MSLGTRAAFAITAIFIIAAHGCASIPKQSPSSLSIWIAPAPGAPGGLVVPGGLDFEIGESISIDTVTFRPARSIPSSLPPASGDNRELPTVKRFAVVTTYQGARYHPETIRALSEDTVALASVAGAIASEAGDRGVHSIFADFQGLSQSDVTGLLATLRAFGDSSRRRVPSLLGVIVPPGDTVAYPTRPLAAIARTIVVRLYGEHRPGTGPGALTSPEWISRQLGLRAVDAGINRLMAELPLFGYQWQRDGSARAVSFAEASRLVSSEANTFRRDQPTGFLTATGRDGWTIWIPDATAVERMVRAVQRAGVSRIMLTGIDGADPDLWTRLPAIRR